MRLTSRSVSRSLVMAGAVGLLTCSGVRARGAELAEPIDPLKVDVRVGADGSAILTCAGAQWLSLPGEPAIPWQVLHVLLPADAALDTVTAELRGTHFEPLEGQWNVRPMSPLATWVDGKQVVAWPEDKTIVNGRDVGIYQQDAAWPQADVGASATGRLRGWRLTQVSIPLLRVNPVTGAIARLTGGEVVLRYDQGAAKNEGEVEKSDLRAEARVRRLVANFDSQAATYREADAKGDEEPLLGRNGAPGYVIITTPAIESESDKLDDFVTHKESRGFDVDVITTDPNDPNWYDPNTAAEKIRNWLKDDYVSYEIEYVLLIGNPNPGSADPNDAVPMGVVSPLSNYPLPSDMYYADLTGDWDLDDDGSYGEWGQDFGSGGVDRNWEVLIGRIPCYASDPNWIDDLDGILQNVIDYQTADPNTTGWRRKVLLPMVKPDDATPGYYCGEEIKDDFLGPENWPYYRVYGYDPNWPTDPAPEVTPCTPNLATTAWNNELPGLVVWFSHGNEHAAYNVMEPNYVPLLDANFPVLTFQVSCSNSKPSVADNLSFQLLKNAAVGTIGSTYVAWYYSGWTEWGGTSDSPGMAYAYAGRIVTGMTSGESLYDLKQAIVPLSVRCWANFAMFNLYGDPDIRLFAMGDPNDRVHNETQDVWYYDIQTAIDDANDADLIIVHPGTYTGANNQDLDLGGKTLTVRGTSPYDPDVVAATIIDPNGAGRGFCFDNGEGPNSVVAGLTITRGYATYGAGIYCDANSAPTIRNCIISDCTATASGGGIYCAGNYDSRISDCVVEDCTASDGGGIALVSSDPQVYYCTLTGNVTSGHGGGLSCYDSSPKIDNCIFSENTTGTSSYGGGVYCSDGSEPNLTFCTIADNTAGLGGGIGFNNADGSIICSTISGNLANNTFFPFAGGIGCFESSPWIELCTITDNTAYLRGGGVCVHMNSDPMIRSCIIAGNSSARGAGLSASSSSSPTVINCTIADNTAGSYGGGLYGDEADPEQIVNCIFWGNTATNGPEIALMGAAPLELLYCDLQDGPNSVYVEDPNYGLTWDPNYNITDDPCFVDAGAGDYHLTEDSNCVNAGDPNGTYAGQYDIDIDPRVGDGTVDVGADEYTSCGSESVMLLPLMAISGLYLLRRRR